MGLNGSVGCKFELDKIGSAVMGEQIDFEDRLRKLASGELAGEIPAIEYSMAADYIKALKADVAKGEKLRSAIYSLRFYDDYDLRTLADEAIEVYDGPATSLDDFEDNLAG